MDNGEPYIVRWQAAGLLDTHTASTIRAWELAHAKPSGRHWQVIAALTLGAILLAAGVLLFVAAHWERVSPLSRTLLVLSMLVFFHALAIAVRPRFLGLSIALQAIGTVSAGAAIALLGQIFNMQEHWPSAILLWALCAAAGWALLHDELHQTLTLLLVPAWIACEFAYRTQLYAGAGIYLLRILLTIAAVYLLAFLNARRPVVYGILFAAGALTLIITAAILSLGWFWNDYGHQLSGFLPLPWRVAAFGLMLLAILSSFLFETSSALPVFVLAAVGVVLPWASSPTAGDPGLVSYLLLASTAVFLVAWGVRSSAKALVNYGMAAFALTVMSFYFSNVMDKLNRSLGLILLGILFLAGGWLLERTRRRLVAAISQIPGEIPS